MADQKAVQALAVMREEVKQELLTDIIPFWRKLRD